MSEERPFYASCRDCLFCQFDSDGIDVDRCHKADILEDLMNEIGQDLPPQDRKAFETAEKAIEPDENIRCIHPVAPYLPEVPSDVESRERFYNNKDRIINEWRKEAKAKLEYIAFEVVDRKRFEAHGPTLDTERG